MASLLGNLVFAGQQTLLTTQSNLGQVNQATPNLYSINTGALADLDVAHFTPAYPGTVFGAVAGSGYTSCTLMPTLFTRSARTVVYFNPNTTAMPGELSAQYVHSRVR